MSCKRFKDGKEDSMSVAGIITARNEKEADTAFRDLFEVDHGAKGWQIGEEVRICELFKDQTLKIHDCARVRPAKSSHLTLAYDNTSLGKQ